MTSNENNNNIDLNNLFQQEIKKGLEIEYPLKPKNIKNKDKTTLYSEFEKYIIYLTSHNHAYIDRKDKRFTQC